MTASQSQSALFSNTPIVPAGRSDASRIKQYRADLYMLVFIDFLTHAIIRDTSVIAAGYHIRVAMTSCVYTRSHIMNLSSSYDTVSILSIAEITRTHR